mmetsp:Transcript_69434/g.165472  ORF Transcript_69434/g.165472 Transcript_69434/m.165472 type:complete len:210 (+) Transcript_69434:426-1055(+)
MLLDVLCSPGGRAQSQLRRAFQELGDDADGRLVGDVAGKGQRCLHDLLQQLQLVIRVSAKGERAHDELVHHHPERPPIHGAGVAFADNALRGEVLRRPDESVGLQTLLAAPEVHQLGIAPEVQHHVLRLQVSVHDRPPVEVLQSQGDAAPEELGLPLAEVANLPYGREQVATSKELGQEVNVLGILEGSDEVHDAGVVAFRVNLPLQEH